jgi:putative FmdB family regulatory protein
MPTYEFRCPKGHEFEKFYRSMSAAQLQIPCPVCGKTAERQVSAGAGLVFKGSGFYITDYGKDGKKAATAGASDSAPSTSDSGASKTSSASESSSAEKSASSEKREVKPPAETKSSGDSKAATASKSAAKKSSGKAKSSE